MWPVETPASEKVYQKLFMVGTLEATWPMNSTDKARIGQACPAEQTGR
jgi:hypothetical protein